MKSTLMICTLIFLILISATILASLICSTIEKVNKKKVKSEEELMSILTNTINREFLYKVKLEFELKNVVLIKDFQKELTELVTRTMNSFSSGIMEELEYYYTLDYITKHVTKSHQVLLTQYINEKKIKTR